MNVSGFCKLKPQDTHLELNKFSGIVCMLYMKRGKIRVSRNDYSTLKLITALAIHLLKCVAKAESLFNSTSPP